MQEIQGNEGGMKFTGKAPPAFFEAVKQLKQGQPTQKEEPKLMSQKDPFGVIEPIAPLPGEVKAMPPQSNIRTLGSDQFENILSQIGKQTYAYDEVRLPSNGFFYNGTDGPQDGKLHLRPMTGEEEQILYQPRYSKHGKGLDMILEKCVKEKIRAEDLLAVDRTYLMIAIRSISYGSEYEVKIQCPECSKKFQHAIILEQLPVTYCEPTFPASLRDTLPKTGLDFSWGLPTGRLETYVTIYRDKLLKEYGDAGNDDSGLYRMSLLIKEIAGVTDKTELLVLLKRLPIQDVSFLRSLITDVPFGVETKMSTTCAFCIRDFEVELPYELGFFFPRHKRKKDRTNIDSGST